MTSTRTTKPWKGFGGIAASLSPVRTRLAKFHKKLRWCVKKAEYLIFRTIYHFIDDHIVPKKNNYWCFPSCPTNKILFDNARAVFEVVKKDKRIKKIILLRNKPIAIDGCENTIFLKIDSIKALWYIWRSKVIFVRLGIVDLGKRKTSYKKHFIVNLWHGIPLKHVKAVLDYDKHIKGNSLFSSVICSSEIDRSVMAASFTPIRYENVWLTGLPRNDYILKPVSGLPQHLKNQYQSLEDKLGGRKLVLYAPTWRSAKSRKIEGEVFNFSPETVGKILDVINKNNAVLGIRVHPLEKISVMKKFGKGAVIDVGQAQYDDVTVVFKLTDLLITDYSSLFVDFMLTGKPMISFAYDLDIYKDTRGFYYDIEHVFPGDICKDIDSLVESIDKSFNPMSDSRKLKYEFCKRVFLKYQDSDATIRVIEKVKQAVSLNAE